MRLILAIFICKSARLFLRLLGRGGTNLPGKLALKCYPNILGQLGKQVSTTVITGTNGKTTSARMLEEAYQVAGIHAFSNRSGANLLPGITAEFIQNATFFGKMRKKHAIIECDEGAFRHAATYLNANMILVTNVFRDQLDRFGEISNTVAHIRAGIVQSPNATICINADCPLLVSMVQDLTQEICYFGAEDIALAQNAEPTMIEAAHCHDCHAALTYNYKTYGHLGNYFCSACAFVRPNTDVTFLKLLSSDADTSTVLFAFGENQQEFRINLPGVYNVYNALGIATVCYKLGIDLSAITKALAEFQGGFGRMEVMHIGNAVARMVLVKNPVGATQAFGYLSKVEEPFHLAICLNDRSGDGTDISWLWEIETEAICGIQDKLDRVFCGGTRANDLPAWLKQAGVADEKIQVFSDMDSLLAEIAQAEIPVFIMPTYTAMLEMRRKLEKKYGLKRFWK